ncbi:MAG: methyltransferase domain-containing protein [Bacteroidetes bacterium]|nr:methyltransferase domain-containing protein [Bacteroidota bacterium]MCL5738580.1 methyltransferase domain-containing protein [Bacteroidota bacterium]
MSTVLNRSAIPGFKDLSISEILSNLPCVKEEFRNQEWFTAESYYPIYETIARSLQPQSVIEIGALQGFSLISMLKGGAAIAKLLWVDNEAYIEGSNLMCEQNIRWYLREIGRDRRTVDIHRYRSRYDLLKLMQREQRYDLIHIDGEHTFEGKLQDLLICTQLKPQYLMLDDYNHLQEVRRAVQYWARSTGSEYFIIDTYRGLAFFDFSKARNAREILASSGLTIKEADQKAISVGYDATETAVGNTTCWCGGELTESVNRFYLQCVDCDTLVLANEPDKETLRNFYSADGYWHDYVQNQMGFQPIEQRAFDDFGDRIPLWYNLLKNYTSRLTSVLEIGCSHGGFLHYCRIRDGANVVGVEVDENTCVLARKRFNLPYVTSGLFPDVDMPVEHFDAITGFDVIEHFADPVRALKSVGNLLNDDGVFLFQTPCYRGEGEKWEQFKPPEHIFLFNEKSIVKLIETVGLEVIDILPGYNPDDMFVIGRRKLPDRNHSNLHSEGLKNVNKNGASKKMFESDEARASAEELEQIRTLRDSGMLNEASLEAARLSVEHPNDDVLLNLQAELKLQLGKSAVAEATLLNILANNPDNVDALNNLAVLDILRGDFDSSIEILNRILSNNPENNIASQNMRYVMERVAPSSSALRDVDIANQLAHAKDVILKFLETNGSDTTALNRLAEIYIFEKDFFVARKTIGSVLRTDPANREAKSNIVRLGEQTVQRELKALRKSILG